jgi:prepilin-type N-terminal cleavage/methylation domain-containing protein
MLNVHRQKSGFSLMELLIYMAIVSVIVVVLANIFIALSKGRGQVESRTEVSTALRFSIAKINQDIKAASSVVTPATASSTASSLVLVIGETETIYDIADGALRRTIGTQEPEIITSSSVVVNNILFTRFENVNQVLQATTTSIQTALSMRHINTSSDWAYTGNLTSSVTLR